VISMKQVTVYGSLTIMMQASMMISGCVTRYNTLVQTPTQAEMAVVRNWDFPDQRQLNSTMDQIRNEWPKVDARCKKVRQAMSREIDSITNRNRAITSIFTGLASALAVSTTLYSIFQKDNLDARVTGALSAFSGLAIVPSFIFFGSDLRQQEVKGALVKLDEKREIINTTFRQVKHFHDELTASKKRFDESLVQVGRAKDAAGTCNHADISLKNNCENLQKQTEQLGKTFNEFSGRLDEAISTFSISINDWEISCQ
jgi:hypothetical protein